MHTLIPDGLNREVSDYINKHDEWGVGLEILIDQISELEIKISEEQFRTIEQAMASMGLENSGRMQYLRDHNVVA